MTIPRLGLFLGTMLCSSSLLAFSFSGGQSTFQLNDSSPCEARLTISGSNGSYVSRSLRCASGSLRNIEVITGSEFERLADQGRRPYVDVDGQIATGSCSYVARGQYRTRTGSSGNFAWCIQNNNSFEGLFWMGDRWREADGVWNGRLN